MQIPFQPTPVAAGCGVALGGSTVGSMTGTTEVNIGTMFFDQALADPGLGTAFTFGRLLVVCRGSGTFTLYTNSCTVVVTTLSCSSGGRPWTAQSVEFAIPAGFADYNLRAVATTALGTLEWTNPTLVIY